MDASSEPLFTFSLPVRWGDMDALGHVNNAVYFTYFEQARIAYLRELAGDADWPGDPSHGPILAAASVTFRKPVVFPATVVIAMYPGRIGRTSAGVRATITVEGDPDTLYTDSEMTLVWVDRTTGRPVPLPTALREALEGASAS